MHVLVTGAAGFIGYHLSKKLLEDGHSVVGIDTLNDYYNPLLKKARLEQLAPFSQFSFHKIDLADLPALEALFASEKFSHVVNLAAQAGVRYSLSNPHTYVQSNIVGFANLLECCRHMPVEHLLYASSSSVYGLNTHMPFSTADPVNHPISLYAAGKKSNELMAHTYSHLFRIPTTGLRYFTVYGPWGRPDMALYIFTKAILEGKPIPVFNEGKMERDFTYIDDIIEGTYAALKKIPTPNPDWSSSNPDPASSSAPYTLYNIGNNRPMPLMEFIRILENALGKKAQIDFLPMQPGDVHATYADISPLQEAVNFSPRTAPEEGVAKFVEWYRSYHKA